LPARLCAATSWIWKVRHFPSLGVGVDFARSCGVCVNGFPARQDDAVGVQSVQVSFGRLLSRHCLRSLLTSGCQHVIVRTLGFSDSYINQPARHRHTEQGAVLLDGQRTGVRVQQQTKHVTRAIALHNLPGLTAVVVVEEPAAGAANAPEVRGAEGPCTDRPPPPPRSLRRRRGWCGAWPSCRRGRGGACAWSCRRRRRRTTWRAGGRARRNFACGETLPDHGGEEDLLIESDLCGIASNLSLGWNFNSSESRSENRLASES
jgi:hypothetical protein